MIATQAWKSLGEPVLSTKYLVPSTHCAVSSTDTHASTGNLTSSVEETALAVEALLAAMNDAKAARAVHKGLAWLVERVENGQHRQPAPIGFYFAKLWYYENLYPLTFTVAALGRACRQLAHLQPQVNVSTSSNTPTASSDAP